MENAKQKAIREAYVNLIGEEKYNQVEKYINSDAWVSRDLLLIENINDYDVYSYFTKNDTIRPKTLQGIETNNGWIRIESEKDLPKEYDYFYLRLESGDETIAYNSLHRRLFIDCDDEIEYRFITHYQPIEKPLKPHY